jgi:hypothetical protein
MLSPLSSFDVSYPANTSLPARQALFGPRVAWMRIRPPCQTNVNKKRRRHNSQTNSTSSAARPRNYRILRGRASPIVVSFTISYSRLRIPKAPRLATRRASSTGFAEVVFQTFTSTARLPVSLVNAGLRRLFSHLY